MPNNTPPTVDRRTFERKQALFASQAVSDYGLFLGSGAAADLDALSEVGPQACGLKLYLDETFGDLRTADPAALARIFEAWPGPGPIAIHAESHSILPALALAERYHQHLHVCHVPHPDDLLVIENARQRGVAVTCEVTPHHLFLDESALPRLGPYARMKPPLVSAELVRLFWKRLPLVDMIASDHAPHARAEKESANPPPGVPGLETSLLLLLGAVHMGRLTMERLIDLTFTRPLAVYGLRPPADSEVVVLSEPPRRLPFMGYRTKCGWTPFAGEWVGASVAVVRLRGEIVYDQGRLLAAPGSGRPLAAQDTAASDEAQSVDSES